MSDRPVVPDAGRGLLFGTLAYVLWGAFPLYWPLLEPAGAIEILAHRIVWSAITMVVIVALWRRTTSLRAVVEGDAVKQVVSEMRQ